MGERSIFTHFPSPEPCCFSLNSEIIKAVTLEFCSIKQQFVRDIYTKFSIPNSLQSQDLGQNLDRVISNFWISGQSFINDNSYNSRNSHDIDDLKLAPVTKIDMINMATSKKLDNVVVSKNLNNIVFFGVMAELQLSGNHILDV